MKKNGHFVVSLDFELLWGLYDHDNLDDYRIDVSGGRKGISELLVLFEKYGIHATWGIVGLLFADSKEQMKSYIPEVIPEFGYNNRKSPYKYMESIGKNEEDDIFHYAQSLIREIMKYDNQEIASHTFSHYYCDDPHQTFESFKSDVTAACNISCDTLGISPKSLIFPRNQYNNEYLKCLKDLGFVAVRGNPKSFAYNGNSAVCRALRIIDTYIPICGRKYYGIDECSDNGVVDVNAGVFFRRYNHKLRFFESIKLRNIKRQMKQAAKKGKVFHIWWHPHNMGRNLDIFLKQTEDILAYYKELNSIYGFESANMFEIAEVVRNEKS